ncbi:hypothetical protein JXA80_05050 [bacterium]|nr:hypothetical protein [candidate division CSSED10-310 bacterium]
MITGYNSQEKYNGQTFHVQTEDRGRKAARIDTIIYRSGGAIVHRKKIAYQDILECDALDEIIQELMRDLHQKTLNEVRKGLWTRGKDAVPELSFREKILRYLQQPRALTGLYRPDSKS